MKIGIVCGEFHKDLAQVMVDSATKVITDAGHETELIWVPGSYEAPLAMQKLLKLAEIDAGVFLGYIERGETLHGEVMGHVSHAAMTQLSLDYSKPIGMGVIGPGATLEQAEKRKSDYAAAAARAALTMLERLK
jgi:6,7-dimethyl-8-ribityllumazine synthase